MSNAPEGWTVPPLWKGERCYILAGGRSLANEPIERITGNIIAIKHTVKRRPDAACYLWGGTKWPGDFAQELLDVYEGPLAVKRDVEHGVPDNIHQVRRQRATDGINGLSMDRGLLGGHCTGGSALNLAFHLGCTQIVLVGYDLSGRHWDKDHPFPLPPSTIHARHARSIDAMAPVLQAHGVNVINTSQVSRLRAYRRRRLSDIIAGR